VKHVQETLPGASASANALDAGLLYQKGDWPIRFGAALRNEGTQATFENEKTSLPRSVDFGASYQALAQSLLATVEGHEPSDGARYWTGGVEWWVYNTLAFRAGYDSGTDAGNGLTMGIGVKMKDFRIDYAYTNQGDSFGGAQRVGVSYRFGGAGDRAYQQGLALMQKGDYAAAVLKFKEALDADPGNRAAMRALKEAAQKLRKERAAS
jgi:tetratricopeptide (TPR) repeat protein